MGDAVILLVLSGAVLLAVVAKTFRTLQRKLTSVTEVWEGDIIAAIIRFEQGPRPGNPALPQSADVIIRRRSDHTEHASFVGGVESLPASIQRQVFPTGAFVAGSQPSFALPPEDQYEAMSFATSGGFRFALPHPIAVQVEENERGDLQWSTLT
ncbi:hypothetical protein [Gulosibacter chungangensis]|nr:hypothetical protein [Gulosibacter chungangensis]